ncbi:MAG TPA: aldo/keto reductase, partial [Oceanipulchritudo sp.]|nr:aldo/keto reductase [Oceanipulchritudo sp.]
MTSEKTAHPERTLFTKEFKGTPVPTLGFGTFKLKGDACRQAVGKALATGYRHLDTARMYNNEVAVGEAVQDSPIPREDLFITSKVWWEDLGSQAIREAIEASLKDLQTDYLDLVLIHWPNPESPLEESIETFQVFQKEGKIRHYGVSNFPSAEFNEAAAHGEIFCNQVEYHPLLGQETLLQTVRRHGAALTAYSPLAQGEAAGYPELEAIARKHGKSSEQVALRWLIEQDNVLAIPRSSNPEHIRSNFDVFDFELEAEDRDQIDRLPKNKRQVNPDFAPKWDGE